MKWNEAKPGTQDLEMILGELRRRLPAAWRTDLSVPPSAQRRGRSGQPDARLSIAAPDRTRTTLVVYFKPRIDPLDVESVLRRAGAAGSGVPLVCAPYLSPTTRERIVELGGNYADTTGNLRVALER